MKHIKTAAAKTLLLNSNRIIEILYRLFLYGR